jgi:hypothetical protein
MDVLILPFIREVDKVIAEVRDSHVSELVI